jgi:hypothetical protein
MGHEHVAGSAQQPLAMFLTVRDERTSTDGRRANGLAVANLSLRQVVPRHAMFLCYGSAGAGDCEIDETLDPIRDHDGRIELSCQTLSHGRRAYAGGSHDDMDAHSASRDADHNLGRESRTNG